MTSDRTKKEKSYKDEQTFDHLIDQELDDKEYFEQIDLIESAFNSLVEAGLIVSKTQFIGALTTMREINVPICEASGICQVTREYWRVLENRGKLKIVRAKTGKKVFIKSADVIKYLTGKL